MRTRKIRFMVWMAAVALLAAGSAFAEEPGDLLWAKNVHGTAAQAPEVNRGVAAFPDGSAIVVGNCRAVAVYGPGEPNETVLLGKRLFLARYNANGTLAWAKGISTAGLQLLEWTTGVAAFPDGSSVVTGAFGNLEGYGSVTAVFGQGEPNQTTLVSNAAGNTDIFVARYNADGSLAWARKAGGPGEDTGSSVAAFADGSSIVTGTFMPKSNVFSPTVFGEGEANQQSFWPDASFKGSGFVARYQANGNLAWARRVEGAGTSPLSVAAMADGSFFITGSFNVTATFGAGEANATTLVGLAIDVFVARYNADGTLAWARRDGGGVPNFGTDIGWGVAAFDDGSSVVTGLFGATAVFGAGEPNATTLVSAGGPDIFVARYNANGTLAWARRAGSNFSGFVGSQTESGSGVATFSDGSCVVTGRFFASAVFGAGEANQATLVSAGGDDVFVAVYNADGTLAWARRAGGGFREDGRGVGSFADGSFVITGNLNGPAVFGPGEPNQTMLTNLGGNGRFLARYAGGEDPEVAAPANIVQECDDTDDGATVLFVFDVTPGPADLLRVRDVTGARMLLEVSAPAEQTYGVGPVEFPHGTSTVLIELLDGTTTVASATFAVQIEDTIAPVIAGAVSQTIELQGPLTPLYRSMLGITVADACDPVPSLDFAPGAVGLGTTSVTATARDATGNTSTAMFDVTIVDTTDPVFTVAPADIERHCEAAQTLVGFDVLAEDLSGAVEIACVDQTGRTIDPSGTLFDVGVHTVTCTAADSSGNAATWSFQVTIIDDEAPVIVVPQDITVGAAPGVSYAFVDFAVTATDECDPDAGIVCSAPWGVVQSGDAFPMGTTTVSCTATDHSDNVATSAFNITVQDREPPVLSGPASATLVTDCCGAPLTVSPAALGVTATDNADPDVAIVWAPASVGPGATEVVFTATDDDGNESQMSVQVTVLNGPFECHVLRPLDHNVDNLVQPGQTVPVKVRITCDNVVEPGIAAVIDNAVQIDGSGTPVGNDLTEDSGASSDNTNVMRFAGDHHIYNLSTKGWPATKGARFRVTIRVTMAGHVDTLCDVILKNK